MCAVYDVTTQPGYDPEEDAQGNLINEPPLPVYQVSNAQCTFIDQRENAANCRFDVAVPGEAEAYRGVMVRFDHRSYGRITPLTYEQGTIWMAAADCTVLRP
jgi:hypothetical protein